MSESQNFGNHTRWLPPFHFFLAPLMLVNLIYSAVRLFQDPSLDRGMFVVLAVGLVTLTLLSRIQTLTVQDRIIRLEERLRYQKVLPPELAERAMALNTSQIVGLRFASDGELSDLVEKTLNGQLSKQKDIKLAIKDWRADLLRA